MQKPKMILSIFLIPVVALLGFAIMWGITYLIPYYGHSIISYIIVSLAITLLGLAIPYWMMKLGFFAANKQNRKEKELNLEDLPKNEEQRKTRVKHKKIHHKTVSHKA